jgi:hypothetical protein
MKTPLLVAFLFSIAIGLPAQSISNATMCVAGDGSALALTQDGKEIGFGNNQFGQLGDFTTLDTTTPVYAVGLTNLVEIAAGWDHSLALDLYGTLWAWGNNQESQLGLTSVSATNIPVKITALVSNVTAVSAGLNRSIIVKGDGTVWVFWPGLWIYSCSKRGREQRGCRRGGSGTFSRAFGGRQRLGMGQQWKRSTRRWDIRRQRHAGTGFGVE